MNKTKMKVFFSKNVNLTTKRTLSDKLSVEAVDDLGKYLDIPLFSFRVYRNKKA